MCETIYVPLISNNDLYALFHSILSYGIIFWVNYHIDRYILNCKTEQLELHQEIEKRTHVEMYSNSLASYHLNLDTFFLFFIYSEEQESLYRILRQSLYTYSVK